MVAATQLEAYEAIQEQAPTIRERVLDLFREYGAMTDEDMIDIYHALYGTRTKETTIRARRIEACAAGLLRDTGGTKRNRSGLNAILWDLEETQGE